jgi:hypothetical protein
MSRSFPSPRWWSLVALLVACSGGSGEKPEAPADKAQTEAPAPNPETPDVDAEKLEKDADRVALVPSPMETQKALEASGIETQLATLIPRHQFDLAASDTDHAAVRTGVVLADVLLTVKSAEKPALLTRIDGIKRGMDQLGGGSDINAVLDDMKERIEADAVTRDELLKEFDELSGAVIPELEFNGQDRVVPLIQAGSWLEGANLVARALKNAGDKSAGEKLLKAPSVVDYFIKYVKTEGSEKAPMAVTKKLEESLTTLKGLAEKEEALTDADLDTVIKVTDDVLALL